MDMNNTDVQQILDECKNDLDAVKSIIDSLGYSSSIVPYLNKYAIIKACGVVEVAFKAIIADYCSKRVKKQVKYYIDRKVRTASSNPSFDNICKFLGDFDEQWKKDFKNKIKDHPDSARLKTSMESLVNARNEFAHGGNPSTTITDVISYFSDFHAAIQILDAILT